MSTNKEIENMCNNIAKLRKINGFTLKEMANKLDIGVKSLKEIEENKLPSKLTVNILYNIHRNFNIAPSDMFKESIL